MYCIISAELCIIYHMTIQEKQAFQDSFYARAGENVLAFRQMLELMPQLAMYIKDTDGRIVALNRRNCEICNIRRESDAIGHRSCDLFPKVLASRYMSDDRHVVETGKAIVNDVRQYCSDRSNRHQHKNVIPIKDPEGTIIGTMCLYWLSDSEQGVPSWHGSLARVTQHIQDHYDGKISLKNLASSVGMSVSTFSRAFKQTFNTMPGQYITQVRLAAACRLLETTNKTLVDIANETGFYDLSHFSKSFKILRGLTPGQYRKKHLLVIKGENGI